MGNSGDGNSRLFGDVFYRRLFVIRGFGCAGRCPLVSLFHAFFPVFPFRVCPSASKDLPGTRENVFLKGYYKGENVFLATKTFRIS
jgi:hypothetical protein